jgi:hypothetical protein
MLNKTLLVLVIFLASAGFASAEILDAVKATARIHVDRLVEESNKYEWGRGTAWLLKTEAETEDTAYMLTAGHMFNAKNDKVKSTWVQFFYPEKTDYIKVELVAKSLYRYDKTKEGLLYQQGKFKEFAQFVYQDVAIVSIRKKDIKNITARLELAPSDSVLSKGDRVVSFGCQSGERPSMIWGGVRDNYGFAFTFDDEAKPGRSGSCVMTADGKYVIGILIRANSLSVSTKSIRKFLRLDELTNPEPTLSVGQAEVQTRFDYLSEQIRRRN